MVEIKLPKQVKTYLTFFK